MPQTGVYHRGIARALARAVLVLACLLPAARAGAAREVEPSLWSRLLRIEHAFEAEDAGALRPSLPRDGKVRLDLADLAAGPATYGPGQLEVLFARIFREHRTDTFSFRREDVTVSGTATAFARARWLRTARAGGAVEDVLTFTLRRDGGDWRVHEVLSSR